MDNKGHLTAKKMDEYFTPSLVVEKIVPFIKSMLGENNFRPIISVEFKKEDNY
jgi:hypothetical protein